MSSNLKTLSPLINQNNTQKIYLFIRQKAMLHYDHKHFEKEMLGGQHGESGMGGIK